MVNKQTVKMADLVASIATMKALVGASQDGAVVGIDSVSGDDYFQSMPCIGTIYIGKDGNHRIIVDSLAYPAHKGDSGKSYAKANRFISVAFDVKTLLVIPGTRRNADYDTIVSCKVLSIDPFTFVQKAMEEKAAADAKALAAQKALDTKKVANARQNSMKFFF